jgi:hypothetical protein
VGGGRGNARDRTCGCTLEADPTIQLTMPWDCFCDTFTCDRQLATTPPACTSQRRVDYPNCGLTAITGLPAFGLTNPVFDSAGQLVGLTAISDSSPYMCPSNPTLKANQVRGGRYPDATCSDAIECEPCYAGSFPCPARDGGARD